MPSLEDMREDRQDVKLTRNLEENVGKIRREFRGDETLKIRYIDNQFNPSIHCCIIFTDSMVMNQLSNDNIIRPINQYNMTVATSDLLDTLMKKVLQINEMAKTKDFKEIVEAIVYGDTLLLVNGCDEAAVLNTKGFPVRALTEPESEKVLQGPREGFNEALLQNLTMLRRRIKTRDLKFKYLALGKQTKTKACICYIEGIAKQPIVDELERRLAGFDLDGALDSNYVSEFIADGRFSIFRSSGTTERPDVVAAKLLEGRVALFVDNTPSVLTVPYLFVENFQSNEDYYVDFWYSSFFRVIRIVAFLAAISFPAIYVAAVTSQQELLPTPLLLSIAVARQGVPFPTIVETTLLLFMFYILKETGIRMSSSIGQALSIVGALVIGQAAVEAKFVSAPVIIVVAVAGITSLLTPRLSISVIILQFVYVVLSCFLGLFGLTLGLVGLLLYLVDLRTFGVRSFFNFGWKLQKNKDLFIRAPWWMMKKRPENVSADPVRMGDEAPEK